MDVKLPDGRIIANVPEGTTKAQLMARVNKLPSPIDEEEPPAPTGLEDSFTGDIQRAAAGRVIGAAQLGDTLSDYNPVDWLVKKILPEKMIQENEGKKRVFRENLSDVANQLQYEQAQRGIKGLPGAILGDPLTYVPIGGAINAPTKLGRAGQAAKNAGLFGVAGGLTDPLTEEQNRGTHALMQGGLSAATGAVMQPAIDLVSTGVRKLGNAIFAPNAEKIAQIDEAAKLIQDPEIAKHMKPTIQAVTDKPWVSATANVMENVPFAGREFKKTAQGYEAAANELASQAGLRGVVQPEDAGRAINDMIQRKEAIPLEQEIQDIAMRKAREGANLRNVVPAPQITEEQAGKSIAQGMGRKLGADIGLASRIREDVIKAEQGVKVPVPDILALRSKIPLAGVDDTLLKQAQAFLDKNAIWDEIQNKKYINADTLYQLKGLIGKATTPKEATTGKYIYAALKDAEGQLARAADQQNKGAVSSLIDKYGANHTPEQIAQFEQQLYGRTPGTAAGTSVSQATDEFNQLFREGMDYKKNLLNKFTKEPIEQAGREVYAQKPLESTFQAAHSALQATPSLFDEVASSLTTPRQKNVFSANMIKLAGGDIANTDQWVKSYTKLPERNRLSLVYGDKALKNELDNLATRLSAIPEKPTLPTPLLDKFGKKSPEKVFTTIASDLQTGGTELANLRNSLTPQENLSLTDGLFRHYAQDEHGLSKIKWAKAFRSMTDEGKIAFANNDPQLALELNKFADAVGNLEKVQGFDRVKGVGRFVASSGVASAPGILALLTGIHLGGAYIGGGATIAALSKVMNDPNIVRAITDYAKLAPTKLSLDKRVAIQAINKAISASSYLNEDEKNDLINLNQESPNAPQTPTPTAPVTPPPALEPAPDKGAGNDIPLDIIKEEGLRLSAYKDQNNNITVGYGFNMDDNSARKRWEMAGIDAPFQDVKRGRVALTQEQADKLAQFSYKLAQDDARRIFPNFDKLSPNRQAALTNLSYQWGGTALGKNKDVILAIKNGRFNAAANRLARHPKAQDTSKRAKRIITMLAKDLPYDKV